MVPYVISERAKLSTIMLRFGNISLKMQSLMFARGNLYVELTMYFPCNASVLTCHFMDSDVFYASLSFLDVSRIYLSID